MRFPAPIPAPPLFKRSGEWSRYSLLSAIGSTNPLPDGHGWVEGVEWQGPACPPVSGNATFGADICAERPEKSAPTPIYGDPQSSQPHWFEHGVWVGAQCRTADLPAEARYQFDTHFQLDVEGLYDADVSANDPPTDLGGPLSPLCAYGALVNELAAQPGEGVGVIHVDSLTAGYLWDAGVLVVDNGRLYDRSQGSLVVIRRNLPTASTLYAESEWAAQIYLSDYVTLPDPGDSVTLATNDRIHRVERSALVQRSACATFSVEYSCT